MSAVEVFASYAPKHRRDSILLAAMLRDKLRMGLEARGLVQPYQPRHRAEVLTGGAA